MVIDKSTYLKNKKEVTFFIKSLESLYLINNETSNPYAFQLNKIVSNNGLDSSDLLTIMKSNALLMMYSLVESTIKLLVTEIYDRINSDNLCYSELSTEIKNIWYTYALNQFKEGASSNNVKQGAKKLIDEIISDSLINIDINMFKLSGNADIQQIRTILKKHGVSVNENKLSTSGGSFVLIKNKRNQLAHGNESFLDSSRDYSIEEIKQFSEDIKSSLDYLCKRFEIYIERKHYRD